MLRARWLFALSLLLGLGVGCGEDAGETYVVVVVERGVLPTTPATRSVLVELDLAGQPFQHGFMAASGDLTLPTRVGFLIRTGAGTLGVRVTARDAAEAVLATGTAAGTVTRGETSTVTVSFSTLPSTPAHLTIDRASHDFGTALTTAPSSPVSFTISNDGGQLSGVLALSMAGADASSFNLSGAGCQGLTLAPSASCTVSVSFAPSSAGARSATLLASATPGGAVMSSLSGLGALPGSLSVAPGSRDFGIVATGTQSANQSFTVNNTGGVATGILVVALTGTDMGQFEVVTDGCTGAPLAPAGSCGLVVRFAPSAQGNLAAALSISASGSGTAIATLSGMGVAPALLNVAPSMFTFSPTVVGAAMTQTFMVDNTGGVDSGVISVALGDLVNYSLSANTCTGTLAPTAMCSFTVRFAPTSAGSLDTTATISATPGGSRQVALLAVGVDALGWSGSSTFAGTLPGATTDNVFILLNSGPVTTGALAITISGANAGDFMRVAPTGADCIDGVMLLAAASCTVRVRFAPQTTGARSAVLQASASPGGMPTRALSGLGQRQATLEGSPTTYTFSTPQGVNTSSTSRAWTVSNSGDVNSGGIFISTSGDTVDFPYTTTCVNGAMIAAHSSCGFDIRFQPTAIGTRSATFQVSAGAGQGIATLTVQGEGQHNLHINSVGGGVGLVTSVPPGISCPPTCDFGFPTNTSVVVRARTSNGSNSFFRAWGQGDCTGTFHDCTVTMSGSRTATPVIAPITTNLGFVTSSALAANLGGLAAYDAQCNALASAAGINNFDAPGGTAFVAWMSDGVTTAASRLGSARGFVRRDGVPFADDVASLLGQSRVLGVLSLDELGRDAGNREVMTGISNDGSIDPAWSCAGWNSASIVDGVAVGYSHGGPNAWSLGDFRSCDIARPIYCLARNRTAAVTPPSLGGTRRVWVSSPYTPGVTTPDAHCQGDRPGGVTMARALIATSTVLASSAVTLATTYVRPDGHVVGTGAQLAAEATLQSGISGQGWLLCRARGPDLDRLGGTAQRAGPARAQLRRLDGLERRDRAPWQPAHGLGLVPGRARQQL